MKMLSVILLVATSVLVVQAQESPALSPKQIVERTADAVVLAFDWGVLLELSENDPGLEKERAIAIQTVERYFPYLLD